MQVALHLLTIKCHCPIIPIVTKAKCHPACFLRRLFAGCGCHITIFGDVKTHTCCAAGLMYLMTDIPGQVLTTTKESGERKAYSCHLQQDGTPMTRDRVDAGQKASQRCMCTCMRNPPRQGSIAAACIRRKANAKRMLERFALPALSLAQHLKIVDATLHHTVSPEGGRKWAVTTSRSVFIYFFIHSNSAPKQPHRLLSTCAQTATQRDRGGQTSTQRGRVRHSDKHNDKHNRQTHPKAACSPSEACCHAGLHSVPLGVHTPC